VSSQLDVSLARKYALATMCCGHCAMQVVLTVPFVEVLFSVSFSSGGTSSPLAGCAPDCLVGSSDGMI